MRHKKLEAKLRKQSCLGRLQLLLLPASATGLVQHQIRQAKLILVAVQILLGMPKQAEALVRLENTQVTGLIRFIQL